MRFELFSNITMSESDNNDELALSMDFTPLNSENEDVIESGQPNLGQTWDGGPFNFCRTTNDINTTGDGRRAIKFEHIELEEIIAGKETLYCCNGRISFNLLITTVNVFVLVCVDPFRNLYPLVLFHVFLKFFFFKKTN